MNPMPGRCPVCNNTLTVTRLQCGQCGTGIDGAFAPGRLQSLTADQVQFVETFIKCRGKIKDVETELGISYPTVVTRLNDVVRAMGYEVDESELSEVDQYEFYEAKVLNPQAPGPRPLAPIAPIAPISPVPPMPTMPQVPNRPKVSPEKREAILKDLEEGKITASEAFQKLQG